MIAWLLWTGTASAEWSRAFSANPGADNYPYAIALDSSGNLYMGGIFNTVDGVWALRIAKYDPTTATWSALVDTGGINGVNGNVAALAFDSNGKLYVGGSFTTAGGVTVNGIAKWDPATSSWSALGSGSSVGVSGGAYSVPSVSSAYPSGVKTVYTLAFDGNGKLYVGGNFTSAGGVAVQGLAKWDPATSTWSAVTMPTISGYDQFEIRALLFNSSGKLYVGGAALKTTTPKGYTSFVRKLDPSTSAWTDLGFATSPAAPIDYVLSLAFDGSENLYVGGKFAKAGTVTVNNIAKFNPSTSTWSALTSGTDIGLVGTVGKLLKDSNGKVIAGGSFKTVLGVAGHGIAKWDPVTSTWSGYKWGFFHSNPLNTGDNVISDLALDSGGKLYAIGSIFGASGTLVSVIAKWDGSDWVKVANSSGG